jgi:hypothetical protein
MKKFLSILCVIALNIGLFLPLKTLADNNAGYFVVTAYYSPLPDQKYYYTGDYESEIKLN